jgi:glycine/D-amino acid oxidase-like deaminating enzyme
MDLRSHYPHWLLVHGIIASYASLPANEQTQIAVMGAGITGALVAWHLCKAGFEVIIVDKRHVGMGSTAASTALLQYEIDVPLHQLSKLIGEEKAARSYRLCLKAVEDIAAICKDMKTDIGFNNKPSLQFASYKKHVAALQEEYRLRTKHGIALQWQDAADIKNKWGFSKPAGLLSDCGAELDPYKLTHVLLQECIHMGARVYDSTEITGIEHRKHSVVLHAAGGYKITAGQLVIACGYESQQYISRRVELLSATYAVVSEPLPAGDYWYRNSLIWETAVPYLYLRTTPDNRILIGGKDTPFSNPQKRDALLPQKVKALTHTFQQLFPHIALKPDFYWAGTFGNTKDGLPYIGQIPERPHTWFALGCGGNGITFSVLGAQIIRDALLKKRNDDAALFAFDR